MLTVRSPIFTVCMVACVTAFCTLLLRKPKRLEAASVTRSAAEPAAEDDDTHILMDRREKERERERNRLGGEGGRAGGFCYLCARGQDCLLWLVPRTSDHTSLT